MPTCCPTGVWVLYRNRQEELLGKSPPTADAESDSPSPPASPKGPFRLAMELRNAEERDGDEEGAVSPGAPDKTVAGIPGGKGTACDAV